MKKKFAANQRFLYGYLTENEVSLLKKQIQFNSAWIDRCINVIDLLVNKEKCPKDANTLIALRVRLKIMIDESDTFRKVLWQYRKWLASHCYEGLDAATFLLSRIKSRQQAGVVQEAMG